MKESKKKLKFRLIVITVYFFGLTIWWLTIFQRQLIDTTENYYYGLVYGLLPIFAGIISLYNSTTWGFFSSYLGRSLIFLGFGFITWGCGNLLYGYYNLFYAIEVPYPSIADFIYIMSWPLWIIGLLNIIRTVGIHLRLKMFVGKIIIIILPISIIIMSYYLLFVIARDSSLSGGFLKLFFDLAYPTGDIIVLTLSLILYGLSVNYLGGVFKKPIIIIIVAFIMNYFADFSYAYTTTLGTFYVASWIDYLYTFIFFLLSIGVILLHPSIITDQKTDN